MIENVAGRAGDAASEEPRSPWAGMSTERLVDQVCELAARLAATTYHWLTMIAELDRRRAWADWQMASCAHWLSWRCGLGMVAARDHVRVARALPGLPRIATAFAAGKLSYSKVRAITRIAATDPHLETELVDLALASTAAQTERLVRGYRRAAADDSTDSAGSDGSAKPDRPSPQPEASWYWDDHGNLVLSARLDPLDGAALVTALQMHLTATSGKDAPDGNTTGSTVAEKADAALQQVPITTRAEALAALAHTALAAGPTDTTGADQHIVHIHLGQDILNQPHPTDHATDSTHVTEQSDDIDQPEAVDDDSAESSAAERSVRSGRCHVSVGGIAGDGPALTEAMAQRVLCDSALRVWIHDAGGRPLNYGRKHRLATAAQRRLLLERDQGCAVPGCSNKRWLDAHHIVSWLHGGLTDPDNLILLCTHHHDQVHEGKLSITVNTDGTFTFRTHRGHLLTPAPRLPRIDLCDPADPTTLITDHVHDPRQTTHINPDTLGQGWNGDRLDLHAAVSGLLQNPSIRTAA